MREEISHLQHNLQFHQQDASDALKQIFQNLFKIYIIMTYISNTLGEMLSNVKTAGTDRGSIEITSHSSVLLSFFSKAMPTCPSSTMTLSHIIQSP